jgi:hypothetical protein
MSQPFLKAICDNKSVISDCVKRKFTHAVGAVVIYRVVFVLAVRDDAVKMNSIGDFVVP